VNFFADFNVDVNFFADFNVDLNLLLILPSMRCDSHGAGSVPELRRQAGAARAAAAVHGSAARQVSSASLS
jgi:hypothetical protein